MKIRIWIVLVVAVALSGGILVIKKSNEKRSSDFFKNTAKDIDVTDGKKY